jgi:hypothetical protein
MSCEMTRAWPEGPESSGLIGVGTEDKGESPGTGEKNITTVQAARSTVVRAHPRGGFTHAVPVGDGSARIYRGQWPTKLGALFALVGGVA